MDYLTALTGDTRFWVAFSSVLCFAFLIKKAKGPLLDALDRRSDVIRARLEEAENLYREAEQLLAHYQAKQAEAAAEAAALIKSAEQRAQAMLAQAQNDLSKAVARQEASATLRLQRAEQEVVEAVREAVVKAALNRVEAQLANRTGNTSDAGLSINAISKALH